MIKVRNEGPWCQERAIKVGNGRLEMEIEIRDGNGRLEVGIERLKGLQQRWKEGAGTGSREQGPRRRVKEKSSGYHPLGKP